MIQDASLAGNRGKAAPCSKLIGMGAFSGKYVTPIKQRAQALLVFRNPVTAIHHARIAELAARNRLPTMYADKQFVEAGGLMSYGPDYSSMYRRVAYYIDRILKGIKPADIPIEQPTKFELIINLKTAKQIGLTIAPNVLARADWVIR